MKDKADFVNRVVRQGNSLCVRIPHGTIRKLDLKEGCQVLITITPQDFLSICNEEVIQHLLRIA
jgi:antitoxin component of MazEF toxin-antitoxin module